jgi:UDP-4-amino-4,6-dideoxy-N-acetyl-beta-L-altrosamine transaminase
MKLKKMIPYSRHNISKEDIKNVLKVIKSDLLTTGPEVEKFEKKLSKKFKSKYASCVNSATSALHLACLSLGLKKGDYLWTSAISFVASANCGIYCGANIDFVDIEIDSLNISIIDLEKKLRLAKLKKKLPKIIVLVHLAGNPCDMKKIYNLKKKYGFKIIEDASHAIGSKYKNFSVGDCKFSDACIFSFHPVKIITSAEGGAVLTNSIKIFKEINLLRSHGIDRKSNKGSWFNKQIRLGFNYRMNDIEAALGLSQLSRLNKFLFYRNKVSHFYKKKLSKNVNIQKINKDNYCSYHLFIVMVKESLRNVIFKKLRKEGFFVNLHYMPIYKHDYYKKKFLINNKDYPNAEKYYKTAISIPNFYGLKLKSVNKVVKIINNFYK